MAAELIKKLERLPAETKVFAWADGERYAIEPEFTIDYWDDPFGDEFDGAGTADINLITHPQTKKAA